MGAETATHLERLDRQHSAWKGRLDDYFVEKSRIEGNTGLSEAGRRAAVERLAGECFSEQERLRLSALGQTYQAEQC